MLFFYLSTAFSGPYENGVQSYHSGNLFQALEHFSKAESSADTETQIKAIYMQGTILAAQKNWEASVRTFDRILQRSPNTSYHDDALYWKAKVEYLKCNQDWSCNPAQMYRNFYHVYQTFPKGDMAPLAFYMAQKYQPDASDFLNFLGKYPDHSISDDVWILIRWSLEDQERANVHTAISKKSFQPQTKLGKCRIALIKSMIAYDLNDLSDAHTQINAAVPCTEISDIYKDIQRQYVFILQRKQEFEKAAAVIKQFETTHSQEKEFSLSLWDGLSSSITYQKKDNWDDPWYQFCNQEALQWSQVYYDKCTKLYGDSYCDNAKLRFKGCQYVLNKCTAKELYSTQDSNYTILDYLGLAIHRKQAKDYDFFRSKIDIQKLESWQQDSLNELDQQKP